ncbi:hypothetical protein PQG02_11755 [Nostoc sp. UHCC 0926]|uniref:hypothetical protein n=1 Tax=unclassified Nostoc TaxID=2593658 RepID=UPI00235FED69|nr:hypothetical protein [Nostoc sp. UHCC 0926]WDD34941.1 hypothetical protein PQG02_11755 [Nostoc sp. UHCC 0926]
MKLSRILLVLGILVGLPSLWETLAFSWDPTFEAPALRYGSTHTNYHAFREFTLTLGTLAIMLWVMFQPAKNCSRALWTTMMLAGVFYYGGWWLPWPLLGLHTPNMSAELVHVATAALSLTAIAFARQHFHHGDQTRRV